MTPDLKILVWSVVLTFVEIFVAAMAANGEVGLPALAGNPGFHKAVGDIVARINESLAPAERVEEVARMLSGAKLTETSRKHAEQMIRANG